MWCILITAQVPKAPFGEWWVITKLYVNSESAIYFAADGNFMCLFYK